MEDLCRREGKEEKPLLPQPMPQPRCLCALGNRGRPEKWAPQEAMLYEEKDELCSTLSVQTNERSVKILGHGRAAH